MRILKLIFLMALFGCSSVGTLRSPASIAENQFNINSNGYNLSGQINEVLGSEQIAIFFHGSGVSDRWETMPGEMTLDGKPAPIFKPISEALNKIGISTCIFDKRAFREKGTPQFETVLKSFTFDNIKSDANAVLNYVESFKKYKKIILVGHSERTVTASELAFDHKGDPRIHKIILMGVLAENLKTSLQHQLTDVMAKNTFNEADLNHDGKIYSSEVPDHLKAGLPIDKIDTQKKDFITYDDLLKVLEIETNQLMQAIQVAPGDAIIMNKPVLWYRELFARKTLVHFRSMDIAFLR